MSVKRCAVAGVIAVLAVPGAHADVAEPRAWQLDVGASTQFPVAVGATGTLELPLRLLLQVDVGLMPRPYAYTIDDLLQSLGTYDANVSTLIRASLANSLAVHVAAGWRPFEQHGFEALAGYTLVTLGGAVSGADAINAVLAESGSSSRVPQDSDKELPLRATLHSFQVTLGWRWVFLSEHLVVRAQLSYLQCFAANTAVDLTSSRRGSAQAEAKLNTELDGYLSPYFTTYVKAPVGSVTVAYRF